VYYTRIVEERDSERDLTHEGFNHPAEYGWVIALHGLKLGPNNLKHQHVVCSVWALYLKTIQGSEDTIGSGMRP